MKVREVHFDVDEAPETFVVEMSAKEAALVGRIFGSISPAALSEAVGGDHRWVGVLDEVCGFYGIFNPYYEDGINEVIRPLKSRPFDGEVGVA